GIRYFHVTGVQTCALPIYMPKVDPITFQSTLPQVFFGGDAAFGPENVITAVAHGHQAAVSIHLYCQGKDITQRPSPYTNLVSQKIGRASWRETLQNYVVRR